MSLDNGEKSYLLKLEKRIESLEGWFDAMASRVERIDTPHCAACLKEGAFITSSWQAHRDWFLKLTPLTREMLAEELLEDTTKKAVLR